MSGRPDLHGRLRSLASLPPAYGTDPQVAALARDPARGEEISPGGLREAVAVLQAVAERLLPPPPSRPADAGIDAYDGEGRPWDVKSPVSPGPHARWTFDPTLPGRAVAAQLAATAPNGLTGIEEPVRVLLDQTYLVEPDRRALEAWLTAELSPADWTRVVRVSAASTLGPWFDARDSALARPHAPPGATRVAQALGATAAP